MRRILSLLPAAALPLAGCGNAGSERPEPRVITQEVLVEVPGPPCVPPGMRRAPEYPDTDETLRTATPARRYQLIAEGRELRNARLGEVEPVIEECRR